MGSLDTAGYLTAERHRRAELTASLGFHVAAGIQHFCGFEMADVVAEPQPVPKPLAVHRLLTRLAGDGRREFS